MGRSSRQIVLSGEVIGHETGRRFFDGSRDATKGDQKKARTRLVGRQNKVCLTQFAKARVFCQQGSYISLQER